MTTYNTIVKSNEINVLDEVVKRCPYECAELEPGKYGFMDNEKGDVRNYFCDTLGYECSNYEAFDFEYFDEPQTIHKSKPNFYTPNGWEGSKSALRIITVIWVLWSFAICRRNVVGIFPISSWMNMQLSDRTKALLSPCEIHIRAPGKDVVTYKQTYRHKIRNISDGKFKHIGTYRVRGPDIF